MGQFWVNANTKAQTLLEKNKNLSEIPAAQRRRPAPTLKHFEQRHKDRNQAIQKAFQSGAYTQKSIADHFQLHYSRVSKIVAAGEKGKGGR